MKNAIIDKLLMPSTGYSAKIAAGVLGWLICIGFAIYSVVCEKKLTSSAELFMLLSCGLLGLDTIENALVAILKKYREREENNLSIN